MTALLAPARRLWTPGRPAPARRRCPVHPWRPATANGPVRFRGGRVLFVDGRVLMTEDDCCCGSDEPPPGGSTCGCYNVAEPVYISDTLSVTIDGVGHNPACISCAGEYFFRLVSHGLNGTFTLTRAPGVCRWFGTAPAEWESFNPQTANCPDGPPSLSGSTATLFLEASYFANNPTQVGWLFTANVGGTTNAQVADTLFRQQGMLGATLQTFHPNCAVGAVSFTNNFVPNPGSNCSGTATTGGQAVVTLTAVPA